MDPRQSLSQLEGKGQLVEPVWSTQLSPDSACSEGSAGSLEPPPDAGQTDVGSSKSMESVVMVMVLCSSLPLSLCSDTDSLSQGSSVGSLCMEDDEDRNSLKSHFDNLASSLCEGTGCPLLSLHKTVSVPFPSWKGTIAMKHQHGVGGSVTSQSHKFVSIELIATIETDWNSVSDGS